MSSAEQIRTRQELIRGLPLFSELPARDVAELCRTARDVQVAAGEVVMAEGTPGDGLYIILSGELEVTRAGMGGDVVLAVRRTGEFLGEMSLLEDAPRSATARARRDSQLMVIEPAAFQALLARSASAATAILRTTGARLRSTQATLMQREKLASLGTLAAGLAHELNNPAAAIGRSAAHLRRTFDAWQQRTTRLSALELSPPQRERLRELDMEVRECGLASADAMACSREEDALSDWLAGHGVPEPWDVAAALVPHGWDRPRVQALATAFPGDAFGVVLHWLASGLEAQSLLAEIQQSATAISDIVRAVKTYAYLDQAAVQEVDVRASLEDTLVMLRHKLRDGIAVSRFYAPELPRIEAYASELNQVWTNLIDNAIHAMDGTGSLELHAAPAGDHIEITIVDDGPGIPDGIGDRIFDPFFTTKPPGVGSGLGLHIAWNIVVDRHRGGIAVESRPGRTAFRVTLPVRLQRARPPAE